MLKLDATDKVQHLEAKRSAATIKLHFVTLPLYHDPCLDWMKDTLSLVHFLSDHSTKALKRSTSSKQIERHTDLPTKLWVFPQTVPEVIDPNRILRLPTASTQVGLESMAPLKEAHLGAHRGHWTLINQRQTKPVAVQLQHLSTCLSTRSRLQTWRSKFE